MKKNPLGVDNFIDCINDCYYVDKTKVIENILDFPPTTTILFTRPRRFGKSLMLSMLNTFLTKI